MVSRQDEVSSTEGQHLHRCPKTGRIISANPSSFHPEVRRHGKIVGLVLGLGALLWFLVRVIPKPSRATYPCQRVAAPLASGFVIWLTGWGASLVAVMKLRKRLQRHPFVVGTVCAAVVLTVTLALVRPQTFSAAASVEKVFNFTPAPSNVPLGVARGIFPGRVVWTHDPSATHWSGDKKSPTDQWWTDQSTDQAKVDVIVGNGEMVRVEPADLCKLVLFDDEARRSHRAHHVGDMRLREIARLVRAREAGLCHRSRIQDALLDELVEARATHDLCGDRQHHVPAVVVGEQAAWR
jgi:hypothetical protein